MNLSYKWLCELIQTEATPEELAEMLTHAGCVVEEMEPAAGGDTMLVAEVTTNRPDWLCHQGVAHELAALTGKPLQLPVIELNESGPDVTSLTSVTVEDAAREYCPRYTARVIQGVTVAESPAWLKQRLEAIGQRPINNIVDITNLICFEMNQPLHAFDYDLLSGNRIVVRMAQENEPFQAITGEEGKLSPERLVIADAARAVALAGVKGGANSEVHDGTVNVLLESAWFQPAQVRRSSRIMRMSSESSYRFERGIDPGGVERASARAAQLILELAGGTLATGVIDTNPGLAQPWELDIRFDQATRVLGCSVDRHEVVRVLRCLGLEELHKDPARATFRVPTFRQDLTREIDLVEEVVRVGGYDRVPDRVTMPLQRSHESPQVSGKRLAREVLVGLGYHETVNDSFVPEEWLARYPLPETGEHIFVTNPVNAERPVLRTTLIPSLLEIRRVNRLIDDVQLFDVGHVYFGGAGEPTNLAILDDRGLQYVRGAAEAILQRLRVDATVGVEPMESHPAFVPESAAWLTLDKRPVGVMGVINDEETALHDLLRSPAVLELDLTQVSEWARRETLYQPLPRFPAIRRDVALVVPEAVRWGEVEACVRQKPEHQEAVEFQSEFRGKGIPAGNKSLAFSVTYRIPDRSLTDDEANALRDDLVAHLLASIEGASLR